MRTSGRRLAPLFALLAALCGVCVARAQTHGAKPAQAPGAKPAQAQAAPAPSKPEPAVVDAPGGRLHGTLELPARGAAPCPVAHIVAGSGPTDRDGDSTVIPGANNSLKYLAEGLAAEGVAFVKGVRK